MLVHMTNSLKAYLDEDMQHVNTFKCDGVAAQLYKERESWTVDDVQNHCHMPAEDTHSMCTIATAGCLSTIAGTKASFYPIHGFELDTDEDCRGMKALHAGLTGLNSRGDFRRTDPKSIRRAIITNTGLPCPDYSPLGSQKGSAGEKGGECYTQQGKWLCVYGSDVVILEQTANARNINGGKDVDALKTELSKSYVVYDKDIDVWKYGDPTSRKRLYIIGIHKRHGDKANHFKWPEERFDDSRYPTAADVAIPDDKVSSEYLLQGEPPTYYPWVDPNPGKLHHLGRYGEQGPGDRTWPFNLYSWFGLANTQLTSNGGGRRTMLKWKPGEKIEETRMTMPEETAAMASLSSSYIPYARQFSDGSDRFIRKCINMGEPIQTCYAIHKQVKSFLGYLGVEPDIISEESRAKKIAQRITLKEYNKFRHNDQMWKHMYGKVRSMMVDTGASGSLNFRDTESHLTNSRKSKYTIGTADTKGVMSGEMDGELKILALNTIESKSHSDQTPHTFKTTTVDGLRTELYSMDEPYRKGGRNLLIRQPDYESGVSEICRDSKNGRPAESMPIRYDYEGLGGWWIDYVFDDGHTMAERKQKTSFLKWVHASRVYSNTRANVAELIRNSYDTKSAELVVQRTVNKPGLKRIIIARSCECEDTICNLCCSPVDLEDLDDDEETSDVIEARIPDEKEVRGTKEQLGKGKSKWPLLKFHKGHGHCGNADKCSICAMVKGCMKRYTKKVDPHRDTRPWHTVHMDLVTFSHRSIEGNKYLLVIKDEASGEYRFKYLYIRSDAPRVIKEFITEMRADPDYSGLSYPPVQIIKTDEPGEWGLKSKQWAALKKDLKFKSQHVTPETSKEAGMAENANKVAEHTIKSMLFEGNLPQDHWEACARGAEFILNRFPNMGSEVNDPIDGDRASPLEIATHGKYSRRQIHRELAYFLTPGKLAFVHEPKVKGSALKPKVRWGISWGMYREQVVFRCPFTGSTFRSKSYTAFETTEDLNCYQFLGVPAKRTAKNKLHVKGDDKVKIDVQLRAPTEPRTTPLIPVITLQSANEYGVTKDKASATSGKRNRAESTPSKLGGSLLRVFDEDGNQLTTDELTGYLKGNKTLTLT